jgi:hypothetical protein
MKQVNIDCIAWGIIVLLALNDHEYILRIYIPYSIYVESASKLG